MMQHRDSLETISYDVPSTARIYDALLGGYRSFECDRQVVNSLLQHYPDLPLIAQVTRSFLRRALLYLLDQGIDQFLDIGSGLPTQGNVHEIVQAINPRARVVYVDADPVAVAYGQALLAETPNAVAIHCDLRQPACILDNGEVRRLVDFERPLALSLVGVLHYVIDDTEAFAAVSALLEAAAPSSYLVVLHTALECITEQGEARRGLFGPIARTRHRSCADVADFFQGLTLVEPGVVYTPLWRQAGPDELMIDVPTKAFSWAGVGCKKVGGSGYGRS
jgi:hypothetical protein